MQVLERACGELESVMKTKHLSAEIMLNKQPISDKDSFFIFGEEFLCMSMLGNLMKNAVEASKEGDTIKIELDNLSTSEIRINNRGTVPEQIRERFFEKYITADKDRGTGLGTYTAKLTAETQGGGISFETSESNGTTVKITFPSS